MSSTPIIAVDAVSRDYQISQGKWWRRQQVVRHALVDLDLTVQPGEAVGYLGANGAGKSTTIKMLTGILTPTRGTLRTCGLDPVPQRRQLARKIGVVFGQRSQLWWDLPLVESYPILAAMHRLPQSVWRPRLDELIAQLELGDFLGTPVRQLSLGQRMRGEVAAALLHSPELVILDEPTIGLDMISKERLRHFLAAERAQRGTTLLLTTHDLGDVQRLCERMVIIDHGRMAFDGTQDELARLTGARRILVVDIAEPVDSPSLPTGMELIDTDAEGYRLRVAFEEPHTASDALAALADQVQVRDLALEEPAMEDLVRAVYERGTQPSRRG